MSDQSDLFTFFLTDESGQTSQGTGKRGQTMKEVLQAQGVPAERLTGNQLAFQQDGVVSDLSAMIEPRNDHGIVNLAITVKADNG